MSSIAFESLQTRDDGKNFIDFVQERGYTPVDEFPLDAVPEGLTIVNASVAPYVETIHNSTGIEHVDDALVQTCVRLRGLGDELGDISAKSMFLTSFQMGGAISNERGVDELTTDFVDFITENYPVAPNDILATHHDKKPDQLDALRQAGIPESNISAVTHNSHVWVDWQFGTPGPTGKGMTLLLKGKDNNLEQVGNVIQIDSRLNEQGGDYETLPKKFVELGFGVERLRMCSEGRDDTFSNSPYSELIPHLKQHSAVRDEADPALFKGTSDVMVGLHEMIARDLLPGSRGNRYVVRKLIRHLYVAAQTLQVPRDVIVDSFPTTQGQEVVGSEFEKFNKLIKSAALLVPKYLAKHPNDDRNTIMSALHSTYGIPADIVQLYLPDSQ